MQLAQALEVKSFPGESNVQTRSGSNGLRAWASAVRGTPDPMTSSLCNLGQVI